MVVDDRPTYKDRHARNSSRPGDWISTKGRIHLRRPSSRRSTFPLQSDGGPYIFKLTGNHSRIAYYWGSVECRSSKTVSSTSMPRGGVPVDFYRLTDWAAADSIRQVVSVIRAQYRFSFKVSVRLWRFCRVFRLSAYCGNPLDPSKRLWGPFEAKC